jgi:transcriptional regulator with XRE-family HTH domain
MTLERVFGQVLQELRQESGLSQEQLGFESGYHRTYISLLERGKRSPSLKTIFQLSKALKVNPSYMLGRVETRSGKSPHSDQRERKFER